MCSPPLNYFVLYFSNTYSNFFNFVVFYNHERSSSYLKYKKEEAIP